MANGYGSSSSSTSTRQNVTNAQGQIAPPGFHYMPDGTLMSDAEHARLYGDKIIRNFNLDLSDLPAAQTRRKFTIMGDNGSSFSLEIKNEDGYYYNFTSETFQVAKTKLDNITIENGRYMNSILFPSITDNDQYDIYLWAKPGTKHEDHIEVRFEDKTLDLNSSTGSNSLMLQKVIYQYVDTTLTISTFSPSSTIDTSSQSNATLTLSRGQTKAKTPFSISCSVDSAVKSYGIIKQPVVGDILSYISVGVTGSLGTVLPGENIHPAISTTNAVVGDFTAGTATKLTITDDVLGLIEVGDKITVETTALTDTVNGVVSSGTSVTMDSAVATKMAVGDKVTGNTSGINFAWNSLNITVASLDSTNVFSLSEDVGAIADGSVLTFTPKCNRETFTVAALNPDENNTKEFSYVDSAGGTTSRFGLINGAVLSFARHVQYQWNVDNTVGIKETMKILKGTNTESDSFVSKYIDYLTILEGTDDESLLVQNEAPAIKPVGTPAYTNGVKTVQSGEIVFNKQQKRSVLGETLLLGGYGINQIFETSGYSILMSDLKIELTPITTTTTSAVYSSATIPVASVNGVLPSTTKVSGLGIDPKVSDPTVIGRSVTSGAGNIVLDAPQTLESGVTLTLSGSGQIATITGNIEVVSPGTDDATFFFDVEKLLSIA